MPDAEAPQPRSQPQIEVIGEPATAGPPTAGPPTPGTSRRWSRVLLIAGAVLLALVAGVAYATTRPSPDERAVAAAIEAYTAAWNAHDHAAVAAAMAPGARFAVGESLEHPLFTAYSGAEFDALLTSVFDADVRLSTTGRVALAGTDTSHATLAQRFEYDVRGFRAVEDGFSLYSLSVVDGRLRIAQHTWWRPVGARTPSMLWTRP